MAMTALDWTIVMGCVTALTWFSLRTVRYMQGVADFLSANRSAGRYLLTMAGSATGLGAISAVGLFEQYYAAGLPTIWWQWMVIPTTVIITLTGWVFYRFRETRCLTLPQFFEVRYSRRFRIYAALIVWLGGILNFAIFPYVASNFFVYYCGLPDELSLAGVPIPTYWPIMVLTTGLALAYTTIGGHITVMITDCLQGIFVSAGLVLLSIFVLIQYDWSDVTKSMQEAPTIAAVEKLQMSAITDEKLAQEMRKDKRKRLKYNWEKNPLRRLPIELEKLAGKPIEAELAVERAKDDLAESQKELADKQAELGEKVGENAIRKVWKAEGELEAAKLALSHDPNEAERLLREIEFILALLQSQDKSITANGEQDELEKILDNSFDRSNTSETKLREALFTSGRLRAMAKESINDVEKALEEARDKLAASPDDQSLQSTVKSAETELEEATKNQESSQKDADRLLAEARVILINRSQLHITPDPGTG